MDRIKKDDYYLNIAESVSQRSTCLRRQYGAIIVNNDEVVSTGYNGAPRGERNCCDCGFCQREALGIPKGERYELCVAVHAEQNAIISAARKDMIGGTIYIVGLECSDGSYANPAPCKICRRFIKNAGIIRCVGRVNGVATEISLDEPDEPTVDGNHKAETAVEAKANDGKTTSAPKAESMATDLQSARLAGGYVTVTAYASYNLLERALMENEDEVPIVILAVREDFLTEFARKEDWPSLDVFMKEYTYDATEGLEDKARRKDALAFVYSGSLLDDEPFPFLGLTDPNAVLAYTDFLSGMLQDQGYEEASKAIDCLFNL